MKKTIHRNGRSRWSFFHMLVLLLCMGQVVDVLAQPPQKKAGPRKAGAYSYLPSGYSQVGSTQLYYRMFDNIDVLGYYNSRYYSSTYSDGGYKVSLQVGDYATRVNCQNGSTINGVEFRSIVEEQGDLARVSYILTNTNEEDVNISMGVHADVQIGSNDYAPINRRIDTFGQTYGLTMMDGNGAQLCVLFGSGLAGVTSVSDFWFGRYSQNSGAYEMVGHYYQGSNWMQEGGGYDSGMGWCWKDRMIAAGSTAIFSYLIGVGEVTLEPNSSFEVTPDDPDGWNDLSRPHRLNIEGSYESPAGLSGVIDYAVEDSEEWIALTDTLNSGDDFSSSLVAMFDTSKAIHRIRFRTRDLVGNTTMLHPIEYVDVRFHSVSGIEDMVFTGDSLYQTHLSSSLEDGKWTTAHYYNNINVGMATFNLEGVFPYTIGRKSYNFNITPAPLTGDITILDDNIAFSGNSLFPSWEFTNDSFGNLEEGKDFETYWDNNIMPGTATLTIEGIHNYEGTLSTSFVISKAQLTENQYTVHIPEHEINYDGESHGVHVTVNEYVGQPTVTYVSQDGSYNSTVEPIEGGDYDVYLQIAEGEGYYGLNQAKVGSFTIYKISAAEWAALQAINEKLGEGGNAPWDLSEGIKAVHTLEGLTIEQGHVKALNLNNEELTGIIPIELFTMPYLENLNIRDNNLGGDIGALLEEYLKTNPNINNQLTYLDISHNQLTGNVGQIANFFPELQTLYAHNNCFSEVTPMVSPKVTTLTIENQRIPSVIEMSVFDWAYSTVGEKLPTVMTYNHSLQSYNDKVSFLLMDVDPASYNSNTWAIYLSQKEDETFIGPHSGSLEYKGENGGIVYVSGNYELASVNSCSLAVKLTFDMGDVNFSGDTNVLDLQTMINYIFKEYWNPFNYTAANLWKDQIINVQDVICMVNTLMDMERPARAKGKRLVKDNLENAEASISCENGNLCVNTSTPIASFDITLDGCTDMKIGDSLEAMGMTYVTENKNERIHLIGYSMNGVTLPVGETVLGTFNGNKPIVAHAMLSDKSAKEIPAVFNKTITEIGHVDANMSIVANADGIVLHTANTFDNISWSVYDMSGKLIDEGILTNVLAGNHTLYSQANLAGKTWIVKVKADNNKEMTKKINIK